MNAGAMGGWIFDCVEAITVLMPDGCCETRPREAFHDGYRSCPELASCLVVAAVLRGSGVDSPEAIRARMTQMSARRKASQPREPSAGCLFKNPADGQAGAWIDEAGGKGFRSGDAMISPVHANFLVNLGAASCAEVLAVARDTRAKIHAARGVWLEPEPILVGASWDDVWKR